MPGGIFPMWTRRNSALLIAGGGGVAAIAFLGGRRVESEAANSPARPAPTAHDRATLASSSPASLDASPDAATPVPMGSPSAAGDLFTRLQAERDSRPKLDPTAERVFAAMTTKLGVRVDEELQVAGFVVGARFCDKVRTSNDVHVVVCEYADQASAVKGVAFGQNGAVEGREVLRNNTSTYAVH